MLSLSGKKISISAKGLIVGITVIVIAVGGLFLAISNKDDISTPNKKYDSNVVIGGDADAIRKQYSAAQKKVDEGMLGIDITTNPTFPDGVSEGDVLIGNPASNSRDFKVRFVLANTDEVVYESGLIPPNGGVDRAKLSKPLAKGHYPAVAYFTAYDGEGNPDGEVGLEVTITVKN